MYKIVVYWRWDQGKKSADCFWCVPWPEMSNEAFEQEQLLIETTDNLMDRAPSKDRGEVQDRVLIDAGYPEAAKMLKQIPMADLRARFNQMEREVFDSDVPLTREQIEAHANSRRR